MRLSSPRFAYLKRVQEVLFEKVRLVPTQEHLALLASIDVSRIGPFVHKVTFVAPAVGWTLSLETFKEIIIAQAIQKYASNDEKGSATSEPHGHQTFIEQHWNGKVPFPDDQMRVAFEKHHDEALALKNLLLSEKLRTAWTTFLEALVKMPSIHFTSAEFDKADLSDLSDHSDFTINYHDHNNNHDRSICRRVAAPVGDALFAAGIACLAEQGFTLIQKMTVECAMTGKFQWETLPGWEELDLSGLIKFKFRPDVRSIGESSNGEDGEDDGAIAERADKAVAVVLNKCQESLKKFSYKDYCPMLWPGPKVINLPNLQSLTLDGDYVCAGNLRKWMAEMHSLNEIRLLGSHLHERAVRAWFDVFDAIRDHPNEMLVEFDQVIANSAAEVSLDFCTDNVQRYLDEKDYGDPWEDIDRSLPLYLSGKIGHNAAIQAWFYED